MSSSKPLEGKVLFRRERKLYKINFEDPDLEGFEVIMKGVSLEQFVDVTELASRLQHPDGRTRANIESQFTLLAENLVSWNYADEDGTEYPATYDGLKKLDFADVMKIMNGWMQSLASVPKTSKNESSSGHFGGSVTRSGEVVERPGELAEAELILGLCDRFHKLPAEVYAQEASLLRLLKIEALGKKREEAA